MKEIDTFFLFTAIMCLKKMYVSTFQCFWSSSFKRLIEPNIQDKTVDEKQNFDLKKD